MNPTDDDLGGDPVCWLDRVCPECGAFLPDGPEHGCARCAGVPDAHMPSTGRPST